MEAIRLTAYFPTILRKTGSAEPEILSAGKSCGAQGNVSLAKRKGLRKHLRKHLQNDTNEPSTLVDGTDYNHYPLTPAEWLRYGSFGALISALVSYTFYRSLLVFLCLSPLFCLGVPLLKRPELQRKRQFRLTLQFKDAIGVLSSFLSAGYSIENAFFASVGELQNLYGPDEMITKEFARIADRIRMNKPVEALLFDFAERSGIEDVQNFSEIMVIAKRSGGELCHIISHTAEVIRQKSAVLEEIDNLTASRRFEQSIMNFMPFGMILYIDMSSSGFFDVMYETVAGRVMMTVCLCVYGGACVLSKKILDIKV